MSYNITWSSTNISSEEKVDILLFQDGGFLKTIVNDISNTGSYSWNIEPIDTGQGYKVKIRQSSNHEVFDDSDNDFEIQAYDLTDYEAFFAYEGAGECLDTTGNHTGSNIGVVRDAAGKFGSCCDYSAGATTIPATLYAALKNAGVYTIAVWVKRKTTTGTGRQTIFAIGDALKIQIDAETGQIFHFRPVNGSNFYNYGLQGFITDTNWHCLILTAPLAATHVDFDNDHELFLDNQFLSPGESELYLYHPEGDVPLHFSESGSEFQGSLDNCRAWCRVLNTAEIGIISGES